MKKLFTAFLLMCFLFSFSQEYYMHDYRMIPDDQIQNHIENEKHFWSKVAQTLIKEGKLIGWQCFKDKMDHLMNRISIFI